MRIISKRQGKEVEMLVTIHQYLFIDCNEYALRGKDAIHRGHTPMPSLLAHTALEVIDTKTNLQTWEATFN